MNFVNNFKLWWFLQQTDSLNDEDEWDFPDDLQIKQKMIQDLLYIIAILQEHLHKQHQSISQQHFSSLQERLNVLRDQLLGMINGRISYKEIPTERVYYLANTIHSLCQRNFHLPKRNERDPDEQSDKLKNSCR